ncbi:MAG: phosphohydrolase [Actinomycetota bacterium]
MKVGHLAARFVTSLPPTPPGVDDEVWAADHLLPSERRLWVQMDNRDRRHSAAVARRFVARRPDATRAEVAGALLHDVGKVECRLGTFQRVLATLVGPITPRFRAYHDHEEIGAALAAAGDSDAVTVDLIAGRGPAYPDLEASDHA